MKNFVTIKSNYAWTKTKIINYLFLLFFCFFIIDSLFKNEINNKVSSNSIYALSICLIIFLIGIALQIYGLGKTQKFQGLVTGNLIFYNDSIEIDSIIFKGEEILKIEIKANDWIQKANSNFFSKFNYENQFSNGIENYVEISLKNGSFMKIQFQQNNANEFEEIKEIIKNYYKIGIISSKNCFDLFGITKREEIEEFKSILK